MRIHFIGICGTAMATVAALLKRQGHQVGGSDQNVYPPMSDFLHAEQIPILTPFSADHIDPALFDGAEVVDAVLELAARADQQS